MQLLQNIYIYCRTRSRTNYLLGSFFYSNIIAIYCSPGEVWYQCTPSCSLADGQVTHFCVIFGNKSSDSGRMLQRKCWHIDRFGRFQTSRVVWNEDPRQRNHRDNAETRRNIGCVLMGAATGLLSFQLTNRQCKRSN